MAYLDFNWNIGTLVFGVLVLAAGVFFIWYKRETVDVSSWKWAKWTPLLALVVLALSLFKPSWIMEKKYFHKPYVLIAMDVSESFKSGKILKLDSAYDSVAKLLKKQYSRKDVSTKVCFFSSKSTMPMEMDSVKGYKIPDSLGTLSSVPNLISQIQAMPHKERPRGIFLISDGRTNFNSDFYETDPGFPPVFPIIFAQPPLRDIQLDSLEAVTGSGDSLEVSVAYSYRGSKKPPFVLKVLYGDKYQKKLEIKPSIPPLNPSDSYFSNVRFKLATLSPESLLVYIDSSSANEYPYNDSLRLLISESSENNKGMYVLTPLSGPDERWMLQLMQSEGEQNVKLLPQNNLEKHLLKSAEPVWISQKNYGDLQKSIRKRLDSFPAVLYGSADGIFRDKNAAHSRALNFRSDAKILVSSEAARFFTYLEMPLQHFSLKNWKFYPLENFSECVLQVEDENKRGCLFGQIKENQYGFFLADFWKMMFSPGEKILAKEYLANIISGSTGYLSEIFNEPKLRVRGELYEGRTIQLAASVPGNNKKNKNNLRVDIAGSSTRISHKLDTWVGNISEWNVELPVGRYNISLISKDSSEQILDEQNLEIKSGRSLELSKIGFNKNSLNALALSTGGGLLTGEKILKEESGHFSEINSGEIKESKRISKRLYNTHNLAMLLIAVMSGYWLFRKKFLLD